MHLAPRTTSPRCILIAVKSERLRWLERAYRQRDAGMQYMKAIQCCGDCATRKIQDAAD